MQVEIRIIGNGVVHSNIGHLQTNNNEDILTSSDDYIETNITSIYATAIPAASWNFYRWYYNGALIGYGTELIYTPTEDGTLTAVFAQLSTANVYFDGVFVHPNNILAMSQKGYLFNDNFVLGSTVCREVTLRVLKEDLMEFPAVVVIKDSQGVTRFTLHVDSVDDSNIDFYEYVLVDKMVDLNVVYEFTGTKTTQWLLNYITGYLGCPNLTLAYGGDIPIVYDDAITLRDYVSYMAEINGAFARINELGCLEFVTFNNQNIYGVDVNTCEDFQLGEYHKIERVYVELGTATYYYPLNDVDHNTVYLNPDNVLITDSGDFTIEGIVEHIYSIINGFEFYSIVTKRCQIYQNMLPGETLQFVLDNKSYFSIAQIDWNFNIEWLGGYSCDVQTKKQEETNLVTEDKKIRNVSIKVDRVAGQIQQQISDTNNNVSTIIQDAQSMTGYFSGMSGSKYIRLSSDGIQVSKEGDSSSVNITDDGVYVKDSDELTVASMKANEFDTTNWIMSETRNGNCMNIYKRRV